MNKTLKLYLIIFAVVVGLLAVLQVNKKPLVDWRKTYSVVDKKPFGLYVFNQEANQLFNKKLKRVGESPYRYYSKDSLPKQHNILIIERELDRQSWIKILKQAERGNDVMVIAENFPYDLRDTLKITTRLLSSDTLNRLTFTDKNRKGIMELNRLPNGNVIPRIDIKTTEILGTNRLKEHKDTFANFIKIKIGKGNIYVHTEPLVLTNYYLLKKDNEQYVEDLFSYLPKERETLWFLEAKNLQSISPLRFILKNPPLRYAWYTFITGFFIFIIFHAKRKQRIIPVIKPLENTSVEFVRSIGNLYLNEGNVKDMMQKKATYFLNKVRADLLIDTTQLDDVFINRLQLKTGKPRELIEQAVVLIQRSSSASANLSELDLIKLNEILDKIYK
ncbi:hypothetical protein BAX94_16105 [Elizabethkingia meningoseptica]|uniref:DUF4350 domain-containing protein n=1 Tax=Elizabethkingia meningoseptica TaxID=238 RepID=A0A1V3U0E5_ELIME|nr:MULTISPECIES: DUF4350 domain-containing protein [Elizabethkingia]AQX12183.1 hypothetical protein BBD35_07240 [Elizabethkingia meningoseptica]MBG0513701.1 hypothetical protein [Elizabethkingia meningoseptica]MDE5435012.1 hypothetical protein [Elizabethkingia meningoseptica]MDE5450506.1 hypothetical protein [Elizabethkingia meningoseptica]MDE5472958.1 hypothetical protein [Elizabethkingia meningoseptica]